MIPAGIEDFLTEAAEDLPALVDSIQYVRDIVDRMDVLECELECRQEIADIADRDDLGHGERLRLIYGRLGQFFAFVKSGKMALN